MKLKLYTPETAGSIRTSDPSVRMNSKTGNISFNQAALEHLKLAKGMKVTLVQDEDEPTSWYVKIGDDGFPLRTKEGTNGGTIQSSKTVKDLFKSCKILDQSVSMKLGAEPVMWEKKLYWAIITKSAKA